MNPCRRINIGRISRIYLNTIAAAEPSTQTIDIMRAPNSGCMYFFAADVKIDFICISGRTASAMRLTRITLRLVIGRRIIL